MWPFSRTKELPKLTSPILFTNTLSKKREVFVPLKPGFVTMYSCGFTVYSQAHIGNIRPYVFSDLIARVLIDAGYRVRRVINITDVGHLVSDADEGEDKMEVGAKREGISAEDLATRYTKLFLEDLRLENLDTPNILFPRATDYIQEQIAIAKTLEKKGYTYRTSDGIYFDTSRFPDYGKLGGLSAEDLKSGDASSLTKRIETAGRARIKENGEKRHAADFALWKFSPLGVKRQQEWSSPWGRGFPGWHLECSAMAKALLGETIDIHTGGIDHIPVHHNNEIAQSESALGHAFVRYWIHEAFLTIDGEKISKSLGNTVYLSDVIERGFSPLSVRYLFLQAHYTKQLSFTWDALKASDDALHKLWKLCESVRGESKGIVAHSEARERIVALMRDDLGTPQALALLWETLRDEDLSARQKWGVVSTIEPLFGLELTAPPRAAVHVETPAEVMALVREREEARAARDFARADTLRIHIENRGYAVDDTPSGPVLSRK